MQDTYEIEVRHAGLHKYRVIRGDDRYVVQQKAAAQLATWNEMWERRIDSDERKSEREQLAAERKERKSEAAQLTAEAGEALAELESILLHSLETTHVIDWQDLKDCRPFDKPKPQPPPPCVPSPAPNPADKPGMNDKPKRSDPCYEVKYSLLDEFFPGRKATKDRDAQSRFESDFARWKARCEDWNNSVQEWRSEAAEAKKRHAQALAAYDADAKRWRTEHERFLEDQAKNNRAIDANAGMYDDGEASAVYDYCDMVLSRSEYPEYFPQSYDLEYAQATRTLIVDYELPDVDDLPTLKEVKYVQARDDFAETHLSESARNKLYDSILYQVMLRSIHELFAADVARHLEAIAFNGWVQSTDRTTGQHARGCVLTIHVRREEYEKLNLHNVEPKACFKSLKGVGSSKLHSLTPVAPLLKISREDKRFVSAYAVADELDETMNLAAMDWEDFEHLIRELFEKEFTASGGEVKVTQASRDGGVDAVAFDPDPIRGGKIVIQAKRYTNPVGVSAVRDLYGTVLNEGATKGILVTTSDYGPDAYAFAKDKPLTLLNGGNLLHLLGKHGHRARINIREAKKMLAAR